MTISRRVLVLIPALLTAVVVGQAGIPASASTTKVAVSAHCQAVVNEVHTTIKQEYGVNSPDTFPAIYNWIEANLTGDEANAMLAALRQACG